MSAAPLIRVRRVSGRRFLRGPLYEVEYTDVGAQEPAWMRRTATPVRLVEPVLGVGDAWAVIKAADSAWDGSTGSWRSIYEADDE